MVTILLGSETFTAIQVINLTRDATVPAHKTEAGYEIADHVTLEPAEFRLNLELIKSEDEDETLKQLYEDKEPFEFVCDLGVFPNMIIQTLDFEDGYETVKAMAHLKQVRIATAETTTIELPITPAEANYPGGNAATEPSELSVQDAPDDPDENESWLDKIVDWLKGD